MSIQEIKESLEGSEYSSAYWTAVLLLTITKQVCRRMGKMTAKERADVVRLFEELDPTPKDEPAETG